jgi:ribosomal protein S18 acetylase RimI-like enzyme
MTIQISEMIAEEICGALDLWKRCEGIGLSDADERDALTHFLKRNPGLCFTAHLNEKLVGTCLCGSDGRRGYLYHLAVDPQLRRQGIGKALVERVLAGLEAMDIHKCHIMVYGSNELGLRFWKQTGWKLRPEIVLMSYDILPEREVSPC